MKRTTQLGIRTGVDEQVLRWLSGVKVRGPQYAVP